MQEVLLSTTYFGPIQWYQKLYRAEYVWMEQWESFQKQTYRNRCTIATTNGIQALTVPVERQLTVNSLRSCVPTVASGKAERTDDYSKGREGLACKSSVNRKLSTVNLIKDLRISDHGNWRHLHWNALKSAYGESPFFDYYQDDIRPFFEQRWDYLFDFNEAIREKMCELLDIQPSISYTEEFTVYGLRFTDDYPKDKEGLASKSSVNRKLSTVNNLKDYRSAINPKHPEPDPDFIPKRYYQVYEQKHGFLPNLSILDLLFNMGPESIFFL